MCESLCPYILDLLFPLLLCLLLTEFHYHGPARLGIFLLLFSTILQTRTRKQLADKSIMNITVRDLMSPDVLMWKLHMKNVELSKIQGQEI